MHEWQDQYVRNVQEIKEILPLFETEKTDFDTWYAGHLAAEARIKALREENNRLLSDDLFPALDTLHSADKEEIDALVHFADRLMDLENQPGLRRIRGHSRRIAEPVPRPEGPGRRDPGIIHVRDGSVLSAPQRDGGGVSGNGIHALPE